MSRIELISSAQVRFSNSNRRKQDRKMSIAEQIDEINKILALQEEKKCVIVADGKRMIRKQMSTSTPSTAEHVEDFDIGWNDRKGYSIHQSQRSEGSQTDRCSVTSGCSSSALQHISEMRPTSMNLFPYPPPGPVDTIPRNEPRNELAVQSWPRAAEAITNLADTSHDNRAESKPYVRPDFETLVRPTPRQFAASMSEKFNLDAGRSSRYVRAPAVRTWPPADRNCARVIAEQIEKTCPCGSQQPHLSCFHPETITGKPPLSRSTRSLSFATPVDLSSPLQEAHIRRIRELAALIARRSANLPGSTKAGSEWSAPPASAPAPGLPPACLARGAAGLNSAETSESEERAPYAVDGAGAAAVRRAGSARLPRCSASPGPSLSRQLDEIALIEALANARAPDGPEARKSDAARTAGAVDPAPVSDSGNSDASGSVTGGGSKGLGSGRGRALSVSFSGSATLACGGHAGCSPAQKGGGPGPLLAAASADRPPQGGRKRGGGGCLAAVACAVRRGILGAGPAGDPVGAAVARPAVTAARRAAGGCCRA